MGMIIGLQLWYSARLLPDWVACWRSQRSCTWGMIWQNNLYHEAQYTEQSSHQFLISKTIEHANYDGEYNLATNLR